jgi:microcystin-dependent protein
MLNGWGAEIPEYDEFNGMIQMLAAFNQHVNLNGVAVWDNATQYEQWGVTKSPIDGNVYRAKAQNTNQAPVASVGGAVNANWERLGFTLAELAALITPAAPPGLSAMYAGSSAPPGWLKENGAAVSRTAYAALFAAIGTTYGAGDGSTTFNLPDSRGLFKRALSDGSSRDAGRVLGSVQAGQNLSHTHTASTGASGAHTHTASAAAAPDHTHGMPQGQVLGSGGDYTSGDDLTSTTLPNPPASLPAGGHTHTITVDAATTHTHTVTVNANGGTENRPDNMANLAIIKY